MTDSELNDRIDAWHDSDTTQMLYEFLGWSWSEYRKWVQEGIQPKEQ